MKQLTAPIHVADSPGPLWQRLRRIHQACGCVGLFFKVLDVSTYRRLHLYEARSTAPSPAIGPRIPLTFTVLRQADLDAFLAFRTGFSPAVAQPQPDRWNATMNWVRAQWSAGHECHLAIHQHQIVSSLWIARGAAEIPYLASILSMDHASALAFDAFTSPAFRGLHIAPALSHRVLQQTLSPTIRRVVTAILPENRAGLRAQWKAGFTRAGIIGVLCLPPLRHRFCTAPGCRIQPTTVPPRISASR